LGVSVAIILKQKFKTNCVLSSTAQCGSKAFNLDTCTEEQLRARCKERFARDLEYKTERAIKHFILKLPHSEIDNNPRQSQTERMRMRKILK